VIDALLSNIGSIQSQLGTAKFGGLLQQSQKVSGSIKDQLS